MKVVNKVAFSAVLLSCMLVARIQAQNPPPNSASTFEDFASVLLATSSQERPALLAEKKDLLTPDLRKVLIRRGNTHLMEGRYSTAFEIYDLAQNIAERIGDKEGVASAALDIGTVYYYQANYPAALEHYQKARELFREVPNDYESAKALSGLALIYKEQRRDAEALKAFQQVLKEFKSLGDQEEMGNTLNSIGTIYYGQGNFSAAADAFLKSSEANSNVDNLVRLADSLYMQGEYTLALNYYKQSLEQLDKRRDVAAMIAALNGAGNSAYYQGNYEEALQYYERNIPIQEAQRDKVGVATSLKGVGNVHRSSGDYAAALENYFKSLTLSEQSKSTTGALNGSIGLVRALQGNYEQALHYYQKAMAEFESLGNKIDMARALSLVGNVYYAEGDYDSAIASYRRGLALRVEMEDQSGQGDIHSGLGSTYLKKQNYPEALDNFQKALVLFDAVGNKGRMADVLTRVAETFLYQGEYSKSLNAAESAISIARKIDDGDILWFAQLLAGKAQFRLDHATEAGQIFKESISTVEALRNQPTSTDTGDHSSVLPYLAQIDLLINQHHPGEAFDYAERAKTQSVISLLKTSNAITNKGLDPEERKEEQRLLGEATSIELQLERETQLRTSSEAKLSSLRDRLRKVRKAYGDFQQQIFVSHPSLKTLRGEVPALTLNDMRSLVTDSKTALLEYTVTETNTYLFVLTIDQAVQARKSPARKGGASLSLKVYPLEIKNSELASRVRNFEEQIASRDEHFDQSARELYDLLIKPAGDQLVLKTKLVIVPDGVLWRLPFEVLQPIQDHYVVDQAQISYVPSLAFLRELKKKKTRSRRVNSTLCAFGNPSLSREFSNRLQIGYSGVKFETSPKLEEEVKSVAAIYGNNKAQLFLGSDASELKLRIEAPRANVLHFAARALLDDAAPMSSFIGLAPGSGKQDEGFLQAREIMNLNTNAGLVVVSMAQQKGGINGSANLGFSWSWFVAGSTATMLGRWEVDSPAALQLMNGFYSRIKPTTRLQPSRAAAMRQSILSLRQTTEYQHPYFWANFALVGDAQ